MRLAPPRLCKALNSVEALNFLNDISTSLYVSNLRLAFSTLLARESSLLFCPEKEKRANLMRTLPSVSLVIAVSLFFHPVL